MQFDLVNRMQVFCIKKFGKNTVNFCVISPMISMSKVRYALHLSCYRTLRGENGMEIIIFPKFNDLSCLSALNDNFLLNEIGSRVFWSNTTKGRHVIPHLSTIEKRNTKN